MKVYEGLTVRCPTCNARPGVPCTSANGLPASPPHRTRLNQATTRQAGAPA